MDAVVLRPLPYDHADRLVRVTADLQRLGVADIGLSPPELFAYRDRSGLFDDITGVWPITANLTGSSRPERVETVLAGPKYLRMLGARPQLGRLFGPQDYHTGIATVVVISDGLWRRGFGADPRVIGRKLQIETTPTESSASPVRLPSSERHTRNRRRGVAPSGWITAPSPSRPTAGVSCPRPSRAEAGYHRGSRPGAPGGVRRGTARTHPSDYPDRAGWAPRVLPLKQDLIASARRRC